MNQALTLSALLLTVPSTLSFANGPNDAAAPYGEAGEGVTINLNLAALPVHGNQDSDIKINLNGFALLDYGTGSQFRGTPGSDTNGANTVGRDQFGISKMALATTITYENFSFYARLGATFLSNDRNNAEGVSGRDIDFQDLYFIWDQFCGNSSLTAGYQPLLFGLHPNGYRGDRTIMPSVEFGGAGGFDVAGQDGASAIWKKPMGDKMSLRLGAFDSDERTAANDRNPTGSALYKNFFAQFRLMNAGGFYMVVGAEGRYVGMRNGNRVDSTEPIANLGVGWGNEVCDASVEVFRLSEEITNTNSDETYWVFEGSWSPCEKVTALVDWSRASELNNDTLRVGAVMHLNKHVNLQAEWAKDYLGVDTNQSSANLRLEMVY